MGARWSLTDERVCEWERIRECENGGNGGKSV